MSRRDTNHYILLEYRETVLLFGESYNSHVVFLETSFRIFLNNLESVSQCMYK